MTPLSFARSIAADLETLPLPRAFHAQLGDIVVPCAGTYTSILNLIEVDPTAGGTGNCDLILLADITIVAARDCANVANDDGTTNWTAQDAVSATMDLDGSILWQQAEKWRADTWWQTGTPTITYTILGGIAMVTLGVQLPIP